MSYDTPRHRVKNWARKVTQSNLTEWTLEQLVDQLEAEIFLFARQANDPRARLTVKVDDLSDMADQLRYRAVAGSARAQAFASGVAALVREAARSYHQPVVRNRMLTDAGRLVDAYRTEVLS